MKFFIFMVGFLTFSSAWILDLERARTTLKEIDRREQLILEQKATNLRKNINVESRNLHEFEQNQGFESENQKDFDKKEVESRNLDEFEQSLTHVLEGQNQKDFYKREVDFKHSHCTCECMEKTDKGNQTMFNYN